MCINWAIYVVQFAHSHALYSQPNWQLIIQKQIDLNNCCRTPHMYPLCPILQAGGLQEVSDESTEQSKCLSPNIYLFIVSKSWGWSWLTYKQPKGNSHLTLCQQPSFSDGTQKLLL